MADDLGIEVSEPRSRKVIRRLDENRENQHVMVALFPGLQSPNAVEGLVKLLRRMTSGRC